MVVFQTNLFGKRPNFKITLILYLIFWWHYREFVLKICQGPEYEEFVSAAKSDNETQFVEVSKVELAQVLYPDTKPTDNFLGIVKSEPERYTAYGEYVICFYRNAQFVLVFLH